jgi:SAM-dependent methyltransferase
VSSAEYDRASAKALYEDFYSARDFKHFGAADRAEVRAYVKHCGLAGASLLDVGCGTGWYTHLFCESGVRAWGIELSRAGAAAATVRYGRGRFLVGDGLNLPIEQESLDAVFLSGFPPYNADELGEATDATRGVIEHLKPGGVLIFRKTTDLTRKRNTRMNHTLEQCRAHFEAIEEVEILDAFTSNPISWFLLRGFAASGFASALTSLFTRLTGIPLRTVVIVRRKKGN